MPHCKNAPESTAIQGDPPHAIKKKPSRGTSAVHELVLLDLGNSRRDVVERPRRITPNAVHRQNGGRR
jgi:hypothetical protein